MDDPGISNEDAPAPTVSTLLNESGLWHASAIEWQLAHIEADDVRRANVRGEHWDERVRFLAASGTSADGGLLALILLTSSGPRRPVPS